MTIKPSITLPADIMEALKQEAADEHTSVSQLLVNLVKGYLANKSESKGKIPLITKEKLDELDVKFASNVGVRRYKNPQDLIAHLESL